MDPRLVAAAAIQAMPHAACIVGFDGFVDELASVVASRHDARYTPIRTIAEFGTLITGSASRSLGREIVVTSVEPGGNAPNIADGLLAAGGDRVTLDLIGTLGSPFHPCYKDLTGRCAGSHSFGTGVGRTLALEFADGKLMLNDAGPLAAVTPDLFQRIALNDHMEPRWRAARLAVLANWSRFNTMTACWSMLADRLAQWWTTDARGRDPADAPLARYVFVDLADPSSRRPQDILDLMSVLRLFDACARTVLSLNLNEATVIGAALGSASARAPHNPTDTGSLARVAALIRAQIGVWGVVVHTPTGVGCSARSAPAKAVTATPHETHADRAWRTEHDPNPKRTTGVGDRFGAGLCIGLLSGLGLVESAAVGSAAGHLFVRHARSATRDELAAHLREWASRVPHALVSA